MTKDYKLYGFKNNNIHYIEADDEYWMESIHDDGSGEIRDDGIVLFDSAEDAKKLIDYFNSSVIPLTVSELEKLLVTDEEDTKPMKEENE